MGGVFLASLVLQMSCSSRFLKQCEEWFYSCSSNTHLWGTPQNDKSTSQMICLWQNKPKDGCIEGGRTTVPSFSYLRHEVWSRLLVWLIWEGHRRALNINHNCPMCIANTQNDFCFFARPCGLPGCGLPGCGLPGCGLPGCGLPGCGLPGMESWIFQAGFWTTPLDNLLNQMWNLSGILSQESFHGNPLIGPQDLLTCS